MGENKRMSNRRQNPRRMSDLLQGELAEEEIEALDKMKAHSLIVGENRRKHDRRAGADRREGE